MMQGIEDPELRLSRRIEDLQHIGNAAIRLCNRPNAIPDLASLGDEVVVRIDHEECGDLSFIRHLCHDPLRPEQHATRVLANTYPRARVKRPLCVVMRC
jgi:hypothetical protein